MSCKSKGQCCARSHQGPSGVPVGAMNPTGSRQCPECAGWLRADGGCTKCEAGGNGRLSPTLAMATTSSTNLVTLSCGHKMKTSTATGNEEWCSQCDDWAEVEEDKPASPPAADPSKKLTFGKHEGKTLGDVLQKDRGGYVEWLAGEARDDQLRQAAGQLIRESEEEGESDQPNVEYVTFGKHEGKKLDDIFRQDPSYIEWLARKARDTRLRQAAGQLIDSQNAVEYKLTFGKYEGSTLGDVFEEDPGYLQWLAENAHSPQVRSKADSVLRKETD